MKTQTKIIILSSILFTAVATIATLITTILVLDKKKDDKELERYLNGSIQ